MPTYTQQLSQIINARQSEFAQVIVDQLYAVHPTLGENYGQQDRLKWLEDTQSHLRYLSEALAGNSAELFADYIRWVKQLLAGLNVPANDLVQNIEIIQQVLLQHTPQELHPTLKNFIERGLSQLTTPLVPSLSHIDKHHPLADLAENYMQALLQVDRHRASLLILDAVEAGTSVKDIYLHVFQRSQYEIGQLWQINKITVAHEHYCTAATQMIMSQLYPYIFSTKKNGRWLVATSVAGELHEIGARMVADFFEMDGWDTVFLGANTPTSSILQAIIEHKADVVGISATMSFHLSQVIALIAKIRASSECSHVKIIVGGYPFNIAPDLWQEVGADGYGRDAQEAINLANRMTMGAGYDQ